MNNADLFLFFSIVIDKFPAWPIIEIIWPLYAWSIFATLPHEMGPQGPTKRNT